jgi:serine/threonine protein kinase
MANAGDEAGPLTRVGSVIKGKWTVDSLLGVGGMAAVYAASHRNGQRAALKILHADFARERAICERFLREAYVSNKVNHSATVQVLDDDMTEQGEPFLIMELLEGETVRDAWKKSGRTMPVGRVLQICERVLDCLASCHAIKVIHRDLKPANIFITQDGEIKVLDFGVAQMRDATAERTATGTALGTPAYMSPEQAMGLVDQLDGRADLFSVGAMMHALITGHRINNGRTEQEALVMAATKPVPSIARLAPHLPIELIKAVDKALAWDRRNRFDDARAMQRALLSLLSAEGVSPLPGKAPPRPHEVVAPPAPASPMPHSPAAATGAPAGGSVAPPPGGASRSVPVAPVPMRPGSQHAVAASSSSPGGAALAEAPRPAFDPLVGYAPPLAPPAPLEPESHVAMVAAPEVPENDPRVSALRDLMKHFDRLLPSVRQFGWAHPATERALRTCFEGFTEALRQRPTLVAWSLRPYSFMSLGHIVWEPGAPFDAIPYNLFACGMRALRIEPGISLDEMRELLALFLLDPGRDLPPEDDLAAAFWERALPHVAYECADAFAEGDAAEREAFYGEADQIESLAEAAARSNVSRIEAKAMALSTDDAALAKPRGRSPFALDDGMRQNLAPELALSRDAWSERYVDVLVEGYLDAATNRDAPLILASLRRSAADLAVAGRVGVAIQLCHAVIERLHQRVQGAENLRKLSSALTNAMFGGETLEIILKRLRDEPGLVDRFAPVFAVLSPNELPTVLAHLRTANHERTRAMLAAFVEGHLAGHEGEVARAAGGAEPENLPAMVSILARGRTPAARQVLMQLAESQDVDVRLEARVLVAPSPEQAQAELVSLVENPSALVRMAALRTMTRYAMRGAWPTVARLIGEKNFHDLGSDERREILRACIVLVPERGEPLALDLAKKGGVLVSEGREATRALVADLLGELSRSSQTGAALHELAQSRWGVSDETRAAAAAASQRIAQRVASVHGGLAP